MYSFFNSKKSLNQLVDERDFIHNAGKTEIINDSKNKDCDDGRETWNKESAGDVNTSMKKTCNVRGSYFCRSEWDKVNYYIEDGYIQNHHY